MAALRVPAGGRRGAGDFDPRLRRRLLWLAVAAAAWSTLVAARLVDLQIVRRESLASRARSQQERTVAVPAHRGRILDRAGRPLAETMEVPSLYADAGAVADRAAAAARLAPALGRDAGWVRDRLAEGRGFVWIARDLTPAVVERALALPVPGLGAIPENRRYYPAGRLAAHVLGIVGVDGAGLEGIEFAQDAAIRARQGRMISVRDARGTAVLRYLERPSAAGQDLRLTLDSVIQYHAEVELDRAMRATRSHWGTVIAMEPATGAILAMAVRPSFNPNAWAGSSAADRRNRAVTDLYEPGSTFKVVVAAAALEQGLVRPEEVIDCGRGSIVVAGSPIRDHKVFDLLTFTEVIAESSNVGAIRVGLRLPQGEFHRYVRAFGFGERAGIELPGEARGLLREPSAWSGRSQASMSIGQEVSATPLQVLRAVAAVGNRGLLPEPHILAGAAPGPGRRAIAEATARTLNRLLEAVVEQGTGAAAAIPGYRVAGKTGTAQKAVPGRGYVGEHVASFAGYAPSRAPALAILVVLDSPRGAYHGGEVAAPVFARVALAALRHLGVPPDLEEPWAETVAMAAASAAPAADPEVAGAALLRTGAGDPVVPDVAGATVRGALGLLARAGLLARVEGTGRVAAQDPPAGSILPAGGVVRLLLSPDADGATVTGSTPDGRERAG